MRSDLVFAVMPGLPNRFLLTRLAATATRKFHRPNTRIQETVNEVLMRFNHARQILDAHAGNDLQAVPHTERTGSHNSDRRP